MDVKPVIAVDFGTSNTYITKCPGDKSAPVGIDFGGGRDGLATAILYREGKEPIIGDRALEEFGEAEGEQQAYTIRMQFKPDIAQGSDACEYSRDFLTNVLKYAAAQNIVLQTSSSQVIFGVPSEATREYREILRSMASESGFGDIQVIDEAKGAIYFHLERKDITQAEATQGALVVDFGGGTCDFALVVKGEIKHSWGDMHLGGRLFDDVFYQWFIEQCPNAVDAMKADRAEFYVLWSKCREVKEKFSQAMVQNRTEKFKKKVSTYGFIDNVTWNEFLERVREYRPSSIFAHHLQTANPKALDKFSGNGSVDIIAWFRQSLRTGLQHEHVCHHQVACVVLTGGSSSWPFVEEIVKEEMTSMRVNPRFVRSDRPYATISQGLSIIPSLQRSFATVQAKLHSEMPSFIKDKINPLVERRMEEAAERIADSVTVSLFDQSIKPLLADFRQNGGSVSSLKQGIARQAEAFKPQIKSTVERELGRVLPAALIELMTDWFREHDLTFQHSGEQLKDNNTKSNVTVPIDIYGGIETIIGWISVAIITTLVSTICGGTGMALIATGPLGLVIGTIIGVIVGALVVFVRLDEAKRRAEDWDGCPVWIIKKVLSDNKIYSAREDVKKQVREKTLEQIVEAKKQIEQHIQKYVNREIEMLSAINQV